MSFVFAIRLTERAVVVSNTINIPAHQHDQSIGANSYSELIITNWLYKWFLLYKVPHVMHIPRVNIALFLMIYQRKLDFGTRLVIL